MSDANQAAAWDAWELATARPNYRTFGAVYHAAGITLYTWARGSGIKVTAPKSMLEREPSTAEITRLDQAMAAGIDFAVLQERLTIDRTAPVLRVWPPLKDGDSIKSADPLIGGAGKIDAF